MSKVKAVCSIENCGNPVKSRGWCRTHYLRWWKHGDPLVTLQAPPNSPDVGYSGAHRRVYRTRGKASSYPCDECGAQGRDMDWAHIHGTDGSNPNNYRPLCVPCHKRYDGPARGEGHGSAKLSGDDVAKIRELHETGDYSYREIGSLFGVYPSTVGRIIRGEGWSHV